jgi:hypothetical protein
MCFSAFSVFESITLLKCSVVRPRRARLICAVDGYCAVWRGGDQKLRLMIVVRLPSKTHCSSVLSPKTHSVWSIQTFATLRPRWPPPPSPPSRMS